MDTVSKPMRHLQGLNAFTTYWFTLFKYVVDAKTEFDVTHCQDVPRDHALVSGKSPKKSVKKITAVSRDIPEVNDNRVVEEDLL